MAKEEEEREKEGEAKVGHFCKYLISFQPLRLSGYVWYTPKSDTIPLVYHTHIISLPLYSQSHILLMCLPLTHTLQYQIQKL